MLTEPKYMTEAKLLLGQKEIPGIKANEEIKKLYADAGHPEVISDEVPWCAAFVGGCLKRGHKPNTGSLVARDYLSYGIPLGKKPEKNAIGIMSRGNSGWEGHVGFVTDFNKDFVWLLGGNQGNQVSIQKYPRNKFLGFVKPNGKADISDREIVGQSRRMNTQTWYERLLVSLGLGGAISWEFLGHVRDFMQDNAGIIILGILAGAWGISRMIKWMSIREYKEGRYVPSKRA